MARDCTTRAAEAKAQTSSSTSNAVASAGKGAAHVFAPASIAVLRITDELLDTGLAFSMLNSAMYARLRDAPVIQPYTRAAPDVVGVGGPSGEILGYVDVHVEVAGVTVNYPLLVVEGLAFHLLIGTDIFRSHGSVFTLDKTARLRQYGYDIASATSVVSSAPTRPLPRPGLFYCVRSVQRRHRALHSSIHLRSSSTALCMESNVAVEPLASLLEKHG